MLWLDNGGMHYNNTAQSGRAVYQVLSLLTGSSFAVKAMRCVTRQLVVWFVLGAHLVAFEWGPGLHRWQGLPTASLTTPDGCSRCCGQRKARGTPRDDSLEDALEHSQPADPTPSQPPHDPRHCSLCKFFAHSPALPTAAADAVRIEAGHEFHIPRLPLVIEHTHSGYLARGPPCWS